MFSTTTHNINIACWNKNTWHIFSQKTAIILPGISNYKKRNIHFGCFFFITSLIILYWNLQQLKKAFFHF
ncbi:MULTISPECIES: DUF3953 domain-containing protein [Bacillus cereus group]|uniref:DUF3953 domain-containing protein n=1 Tax=Bacillus luti TaxID=2026191 RepID=A0A7V7S535_9BACI|nr:DUF3953 domain-containing protein [Bacillus luti]